MNNYSDQELLSMLSQPCELAELLNLSKQENGDLISKSSFEVMKIALEYARLAALSHRSELDNQRVGEILEVANHSAILSFWVVEIDHFLGHYLGLLDEDDRESYRDQQALLQDYVGEYIAELPSDEQGRVPC